MEKLSDKILDRIKEQKVRPKARWYFILMNILLIAAIVFSIIIGSLAVAIIIRHFSWADWELAHHFSGSRLKSFFLLLPYLWLIFILFAIFFADQLFKHTKTGYRIKSWVILLSSILLSLNFGYILYLVKLDRSFEDVLITNIPMYQSWETRRDQLFAAPEMGVLAGQIIKIKSEDEWELLDFANHEWEIDVRKAKIRNDFTPVEGLHVGIIGEPTDKNEFQAKVVTLWKKQIFRLPPPAPAFLELKIE